jgi:hypothetical protein
MEPFRRGSRIPGAWRRWPEVPLLLGAGLSQLLLAPGGMARGADSEPGAAALLWLLVWLAGLLLALAGRLLALRQLEGALAVFAGSRTPGRTRLVLLLPLALAAFGGWGLAASLRSAGLGLPGRGGNLQFGASAFERFESERRLAESLGAPAPDFPAQAWLLPEALWLLLLLPALFWLMGLLRLRFPAAFSARPLLVWSSVALPIPLLYFVASGYGFAHSDLSLTDACLSAFLTEACWWWLPQTAGSLLALCLWIPLLAWARWVQRSQASWVPGALRMPAAPTLERLGGGGKIRPSSVLWPLTARTAFLRRVLGFSFVCLLAVCAADRSGQGAQVPEAAGAMPPPEIEAPLEQHRWLSGWVGDWEVESRMGEGAEALVHRATEKVRAIGELWIQGELSSELAGQPMRALITLGYDPLEQAFVGTWLDSFHHRLWVYRGVLDETGRILMLEARGPTMDGSLGTTLYRDAFEVLSPDRRRLRASVMGPDGQWIEFMQTDYRRVPAP